MRFKINYSSEELENGLKENKEKFIKDHELENDELAKILIYSMPIALGDTDVAAFMLLLDTYTRYLQIKQLLNHQGLIVYSSTGSMIVNKLLNAEKNYTQLLMQQLRSFGLTQDTRVGLESLKMTEAATEQDEVMQLIKSLKDN